MLALLSKIIKINTLTIVGVSRADHGDSFNLLTVKRKGNKIDILETATYDSYEELKKKIDIKLPVIVALDGKGVLNKKIDFNNEGDVNWQKNVDYNSIYFTAYKSGTANYMSFCRKNAVDEVLQKFIGDKFQVVDVYIGAFLTALLQPAVNEKKILSGDLMLEFDDEGFTGFTKQFAEIPMKLKYKIGDDSINSDFIPLYGVLVHFFLQPKEVTKTESGMLNVEEIIYKKAFTLFGTIMLVGFLLSLMASYLLIQYYGSKNAELNLQNVYSNQSYQLILEMEKQKEQKENILKESGFSSSKFLTYYSYELIKMTPGDIRLNEVNIVPLAKEVKANERVLLDPKTILLKGETYNETSFNNWMSNLKTIKWIKKFEINALKKDKKNKSQFEVKITIKDV
ncbi:PilN domain-containing protein [Flavobacterium cerinum]|uniref:Uncharacterized protein n=1 Tax=Flavobacterium cerinum TaxID=2502784 RepID=A0ABY5IUM4_9FLAO|nr:hypothetical protein [Flavobacterium cerinum]UUC46509.1 hypothetical protein NOX80_04740 [Flavobacterium cerinum]